MVNQEKKEILGFTKEGEPIYPLRPGFIYTACTINCSGCSRMIRSMGGPRHGAICWDCNEAKSV